MTSHHLLSVLALAAAPLALLGCAEARPAAVAPSAADDADQIFGGKLPPGYRDWRLISVAHEAGELDDLRAVLGNDLAIKAFRDGTLPFPDGAIIARVAWKYTPSDDNNQAFGRPQSFVAGPPVNGVQFMVKDAKKFAATAGWGFAQFNAGKPVTDEVKLKGCFGCHAPYTKNDLVFTHYAP